MVSMSFVSTVVAVSLASICARSTSRNTPQPSGLAETTPLSAAMEDYLPMVILSEEEKQVALEEREIAADVGIVDDGEVSIEDLDDALQDAMYYSTMLLQSIKAAIKFLAVVEKSIVDDPLNPKLKKALSLFPDITSPMSDIASEYGIALHAAEDMIEYPLGDHS